MSAHEQAVLEAHSFINEHPEFRPPKHKTSRSRWLMAPNHNTDDGHRIVAFGGRGDLEMMERILGWRPIHSGRSRTLEQRALDVRMDAIIEKHLSEKDRCLIREAFFENLTLKEMGQARGVSYQAVQQQLKKAVSNLKLAIVDHGAKYIEVRPEDL